MTNFHLTVLKNEFLGVMIVDIIMRDGNVSRLDHKEFDLQTSDLNNLRFNACYENWQKCLYPVSGKIIYRDRCF